jgi:hypothetical protein
MIGGMRGDEEETMREAILAFPWWDYGLDLVGEADPGYAAGLAAAIVDALVRRDEEIAAYVDELIRKAEEAPLVNWDEEGTGVNDPKPPKTPDTKPKGPERPLPNPNPNKK